MWGSLPTYALLLSNDIVKLIFRKVREEARIRSRGWR
jgi:hypothetical protein